MADPTTDPTPAPTPDPTPAPTPDPTPAPPVPEDLVAAVRATHDAAVAARAKAAASQAQADADAASSVVADKALSDAVDALEAWAESERS